MTTTTPVNAMKHRDERPRANKCARALAFLLFAALSAMAPAVAETPITLLQQHIGHTNYVATGGTFRTNPNTSNACSVTASSPASVNGIPGTGTIRAVYLYWVGSGNTIDTSVNLNGTPISAQRTDTAVFSFNGTDYEFFTGFAEISGTNIVSGNGTYTLSGLSFATGNPYCSTQVVVGGWSLYVVYDDPNEALYAVNIFDGFQYFRGSSINLTASGFRIPANFIDGRFTFSTYDGDPQNSNPVGGFSESLRINGNIVDDGLVPPASNPALQQYDGTINAQGIINSHGVDIDTYDVTTFLSPGDTTATVTMSAGGDLVLSTGMIIAVNSEPVADLEVVATHTDTFVSGQSAELLVDVTNNGPEPDPTTINAAYTLPAEFSFVSSSGTGWACSASGQLVTCTHDGPLPAGSSLPQLALLVDVLPGSSGTVNGVVDVSSDGYDSVAGNNQATDAIDILAPDVSTSTKTVLDLNGGDAEPGDVLRYTISINETGNLPAADIRVTDDIPLLVSSYSIVSLPGGAVDNSSATGGANGTGIIDVQNIDLAAGASTTIVFDAVIDSSASPGDVVSNAADIANPNGPGTTAIAPNVIVSASQIGASGTKTLYLYDNATSDPNGFNNGPQPYLSRTPPAGLQSALVVRKDRPPVTWRLTPALQSSLLIGNGSVPVTLYLSHSGNGGTRSRSLEVRLTDSTGLIGSPVTLNFAVPAIASPAAFTFNVPLPSDRPVNAGETIVLTVSNVTPGGGARRTLVHPVSGTNFSRVDMTALTVIDVQQIDFFDTAYPAGAPLSTAPPGTNISIRATISDPFGSFDIASASIDIEDPDNSPVVSSEPMTLVEDSGAATAVFEYLFTIPANGADGNWTVRVTGVEGTEGIVTHTRVATFSVVRPQPELAVTKSVTTESDPVNGNSSPKSIPGAISLYTITVRNDGDGSPDSGSLEIFDAVPAGTDFVVDPVFGDPVTFQDGSDPSGLTFDYATDVSFSIQPGGGPPYDYTPSSGPDGTDPSVTGIFIAPGGSMNVSTGGTQPSFTVQFRVRIRD